MRVLAGHGGRVAGAAIALLLMAASQAVAQAVPPAEWPSLDAVPPIAGETVRFPSASPFALTDVGNGRPTEALGTLFMPANASAGQKVPAVVMLHGASGVQQARELTYGRQFAAAGVAAMVVDAFGARRDFADGFIGRLLNITEMMMVSDAYAALEYLDAMPEVDASRVVLIGFSYGAMASVFAAYAQVADRIAPDGPRFAAHVAYYGPCIARFEDPRTTGAPVLMLSGGRDAIIDQARCAEIADDLHAGGSVVKTVVYPDAVHQWDGGRRGPRMIGRNLAGCRLRVSTGGRVQDRRTFLPMIGALTRRLILGNCATREGYLIGRDDAVRTQSDADLWRFLMPVFAD